MAALCPTLAAKALSAANRQVAAQKQQDTTKHATNSDEK